MLGDASIERVKPTHNARKRFDQTYPKHSPYIQLLYSIFNNLVISVPKVHTRKPDVRTGKIYSTIAFKSRNLPCLNPYQEMFYKEGVKIVPSDIDKLLTARALAFWIMDDGNKTRYNQTLLHTNSFSFPEINLLQQALASNLKLKTRLILDRPGQWTIVIPVKQIIPLKEIVIEYKHESMLYKI
jgi:hypothetical protein